MTQPFAQGGAMKKRTAVLVFLKGTTAPLVLYPESPLGVYEELTTVLKNGGQPAKIIEKSTNGPIKKISILSTEICAIALQEEAYM